MAQAERVLKKQKGTAPTTMVEVEVTDIPSAVASSGRANVRIEFENGLVLDRRDMEVERLIDFLF